MISNFFKKRNSDAKQMNVTKATEEDKKEKEFLKIMAQIPLLEDEPTLLQTDITAKRFLKSRDYNMANAEKLLKADIEWRRTKKPLDIKCSLCMDKPGAHSMRQIGFDLFQRPVIYSSFTQASVAKVEITEVIDHMIYVLENCVRTMIPGVYQWILIFDCSGMSIQSCNLKLGSECIKILSDHYPERLAHCFCVRPGNAFRTALSAIKKVMPPATAKKLIMVKFDKEENFTNDLEKYFDKETLKWLYKEIKLNKRSDISTEQKTFWKFNKQEEHDPRGEDYYVSTYVRTNAPYGHKPHPNILQDLEGENLVWQREENSSEVEEDTEEDASMFTENRVVSLNGTEITPPTNQE